MSVVAAQGSAVCRRRPPLSLPVVCVPPPPALVALLVQPALSGALGGARGVQWKKGWGGPPRTEAGGRLAFRLLTPIATAIVSDPPGGGGNVTLSFRHSDPVRGGGP